MADDKVSIVVGVVDNATTGLKNINKEVNNLTGGSNMLGTALKGFVTIEIAKMVFEFGKMGAKALDTQRIFETYSKNFKINGDVIIKSMLDISKGAMDDEDAMQSMIKATQLLGTSAIGNMEKFTEIARASAIAFGGDTQTNLDTLITSMGRMTERQLVAMGITLDMTKAYDDYASKTGRVSSELTEAEKRQVFMNETLKQGKIIVEQYGDAQQTSSEKFKQTEVDFKNLQENLSKNLLPALNGILKVVNMIMDGWTKIFRFADLDKSKDIENSVIQSQIYEKQARQQQIIIEQAGKQDKILTREQLVSLAEKNKEYMALTLTIENLHKTMNGQQISPKVNVPVIPKITSSGIIAKTDEEIKAEEDERKRREDLLKEAIKTKEAIEQTLQSSINGAVMNGVMSSLNLLGQGFADLAMGVEGAWAKMGKGMLLTFLDVIKQILMAQTIAMWATGNIVGAVLAGAGVVALTGISAYAGAMIGGEKTTGTSSSTSASSGSTTGTIATSAISNTSSSAGGNLVINLYNPLFMDKETKLRTIDDLLVIAQSYGWDIKKSTGLVMA